jgi:hypothetical protein
MIGKSAAGEPVLPVVRGPDKSLICLLKCEGRFVFGAGESAKPRVALLEQRPRGRTASLEAQPHVYCQGQLKIPVLSPRYSLVVSPVRADPGDGAPNVVEDWLTLQRHLNFSHNTPNGAQQNLISVVVSRGSFVCVGQLTPVIPRADQQNVTHNNPTRRCAPAGFQHHSPQ